MERRVLVTWLEVVASSTLTITCLIEGCSCNGKEEKTGINILQDLMEVTLRR